jgi:hypothetical protein
MKTPSIARIIIFCITPLPIPTHAFIYLARVFQSKDKLFIGLSDYHETEYAQNRVGDQQRYELLKWAYMLRASLIIEDMSEESRTELPDDFRKKLNEMDPLVLMHFNDQESALAFLHTYCKELHIPFENCEFRQAATDSERHTTVPYYFALQELGKIMREINRYNDSPALNAIYKRELALLDTVLQESKKFFNLFIENRQLSLYEFMQNPQNFITYRYELERLISYYHLAAHPIKHLTIVEQIHMAVRHYADNLLELKMMHAAYNQKSQVIIFYAGGFHIHKIAEYFKEIGHTELLWFVQDSLIENEPKAIDIDDSLKKISRLLPTLQLRNEVPLLLYEMVHTELKKSKNELNSKQNTVITPIPTIQPTPKTPEAAPAYQEPKNSYNYLLATFNGALTFALVNYCYKDLSVFKKIPAFLGLFLINDTIFNTIAYYSNDSNT